MSMGKRVLYAALGIASVSMTMAIAADEPAAPATQPSAPVKLFEPYTLLKDLTPEQSAQIEKIHKDFLEERRKLETKQKDDIAAVLTPAQATELIQAEDKLKAEQKKKLADKKKAATPARSLISEPGLASTAACISQSTCEFLHSQAMIPLAFSTNAFKKNTLSEAIAAIAAVGYTGVELMADVPHAHPASFTSQQRDQLRNQLASLGIAVSNVNGFTHFANGDTYHPTWIEDDPAKRQLRIAHTLGCVQLAAEFGAKTLSLQPGGPTIGTSITRALAGQRFCRRASPGAAAGP